MLQKNMKYLESIIVAKNSTNPIGSPIHNSYDR